MKALKENDMEAYASLLAETKNERLSSLLQQTEVASPRRTRRYLTMPRISCADWEPVRRVGFTA
jgi:hypothetical protein